MYMLSTRKQSKDGEAIKGKAVRRRQQSKLEILTLQGDPTPEEKQLETPANIRKCPSHCGGAVCAAYTIFSHPFLPLARST